MDNVQIRIECIKLVNRSDLMPNEVVNRAKIFEQYLLDNLETSPVARRGRPPSKKPALEVRNDPE